MKASDVPRAVEAAVAAASAGGLTVDEATVIHESNRIAVRLLPGDILARVAYEVRYADAEFEVEVARQLTAAGSPVAHSILASSLASICVTASRSRSGPTTSPCLPESLRPSMPRRSSGCTRACDAST